MRRDVFVYLSGPITATDGLTVEGNVALAVAVYLDCLRRGVPAFCPHLSAIFPSAWAIDWSTWLVFDEAVIDRCTHVVMLEGWETSRGAVRERAYAIAHSLPIFESIDDLVTYLDDARVA